jgi:hypothetical protein
MQLLVDVDPSAMADVCSTALGIDGVTSRDIDGEPIGGASNGIKEKRSHAKDGLSGVAHGISNGETISGATVGQRHWSTRWRSGATIGFGGAAHRDGNGETNNDTNGDGVDTILLMEVKTMDKDE